MTKITEQPNWAYSALNRPIALHQCWDKAIDQKPLLMIGGVHGDEPEGVVLANALLGWLKNQSSFKLPWLLIPCINPDGIAHNQRTNGNGVDLNRNFPACNWQPDFEKPRYFPGKAPNTEPEVSALVNLINECQPQLIIHFHSWEPCIVVTGKPGLELGTLFSEASSYPLKETIGYETPGSLGDYGWHDCQTPVICIEEQEGINQECIWNKFSKAFKAIF